MMSVFLIVVALIQFSVAGFYDTTCLKLRCSRGEMEAVNNAKMRGLGNHTCQEAYIKFNPIGTINFTLEYTSVVNSQYIAATGSLHSDYTTSIGTSVTIDEYCDGHGNVCIEIVGAPNGGYYTESIDQNKGGLGTAHRAIGYYTLNAQKDVAGIQQFIPTYYGDVLFLEWLDADKNIDYIVTQKCTRI